MGKACGPISLSMWIRGFDPSPHERDIQSVSGSIDLELSWVIGCHRCTPSYHPFIDGTFQDFPWYFHYRPSSYWGTLTTACKPRFHAHELGPDPDLVDTPATSLVRHGAVLGMKSLTNHKSQSHNKLLRDQRFFPWKPARHISNSSSFPWTLISHQVYSAGTCSYQTYSWCHWPGLKRTQHVGNRVDKEVVRG